jgi:hypothetical protein
MFTLVDSRQYHAAARPATNAAIANSIGRLKSLLLQILTTAWHSSLLKSAWGLARLIRPYSSSVSSIVTALQQRLGGTGLGLSVIA